MKRTSALICACAAAGALAAGGSAVANSTAHTARAQSSGLDREYLTTSMEGDLFEIQGGKLAEARSGNPAVLKLARTLISDHTKSFHDAATLARRVGVEVPSDPTPSEQWELSVVRSLRGDSFNDWYSSLEVKDHEQDIDEATIEVRDGSNSSVRSDARQELPMLRMHERLSRQALSAS